MFFKASNLRQAAITVESLYSSDKSNPCVQIPLKSQQEKDSFYPWS